MYMTHHSCHSSLIFISSKPTRYILMAGNGLFPKDLKPCWSTSLHTPMPFLHSSWLYPGELSYFEPSAHKVTASSSRPNHTGFSPAFIHLIFVILPTHDCAENAEIFGIFLRIWHLEWYYVRIPTFIRKKRELFNLHGYKVKLENVKWIFFSRIRCLRLWKRERKYTFFQVLWSVKSI